MTKFLFGNNLNTLLSTNIDENATIITVSTGAGFSFPTPNKDQQDYFAITLTKHDNDDNTEICFVTAKDGDKFTVLRGQEGTVAQKWDQGTRVSNRITAEPLNQIKDKADQSYVDDKIGKINFTPYYKKSGDKLTGPMETNGKCLWGSDKNTYLVGLGNSWYIKAENGNPLISFENGSIVLNGQYSSFVGNMLQTNTIKNNNATNNDPGKVIFDTATYFIQPVVVQSSFNLNYNDFRLTSNASRPESGQFRAGQSILLKFQDDDYLYSNIYNQENVGSSNNLIINVRSGNDQYYYILDHLGRIISRNITVEETINTKNIQTNNLTVQDNTLTIQSNNIAPDGNGFIHGNGIYFNLQQRGVNGSIYLQEHPGIETDLIFQASGGGTTSSMSFNTAGTLSVPTLQTNIIKNNNGSQVDFQTTAHFSLPVVVQSSFRLNNNDLNIYSNIPRPNVNQYRNTNSLQFQFSNDINMQGNIYFQEHVGVSNNLIFYVKGGDNGYNYIFDNFGNITAENFQGTALQAQYADLAEYYISDKKYDPGTIVKIGGINEITTASKGGFFMGIISTNPGLKMNEMIKDHPLALLVALAGRVPVKVTGAISKGDPITLSDINGIATKLENKDDLIGFALESNDDPLIKLVECSITSIGRC